MKRITSLLLLCLAAGCSGDAAPGAVDAGSVAGDPDALAAQDAAAPRLVTALTAGVATPWLVPVGVDGAGEPVRLAPRRGDGYDGAEGTVAYPQMVPDGSAVVVVYQEVSGDTVLFALPTDGSAADGPIAVARVTELSALDRAYGGERVAFVAERSLYSAALDGSDSAPVLLASPEEGGVIERPHWVPGTDLVAYDLADAPYGDWSRAWTARADGSGEPVSLSGTGPILERVVATLPGGRVLAGGADDRIYAVPAAGGAAVVLTPPGRLTSYQGAVASGDRIILELRTQGVEGRELVSVATDGSDADAPITLTAEPSPNMDVAVQRDGDRVAWSAKGAGEQWAVYEASAMEKGTTRQIVGWSSKRLYVTSYAGGVIAGATEEGKVLRFRLPGGVDTKPLVLHNVGTIVNHSFPWPVVSASAAHVLYQANTPEGWRSWVTPADGGAPTQHEGAWYWDLVTPFGILTQETVTLGAVAATPQGSAPALLTPWHEGPILAPHIAGPWVIYGCESPTPGWYAAPIDGSGGPEAPALTVDGDGQWWLDRPFIIAGTLVHVAGSALVGVTLDAAGHGEPRQLLTGVTGPPLALPEAGILVVPQGTRVVSLPVLGGDPILVMDAGGPVQGVVALPGGERVLALANRTGTADTLLLAARIDGSEAGAPEAVGEGLAGWLISVTITPDGGHALTELSIEATAVPHPDVLMTSTIGVDPPETAKLTALPLGRWGSNVYDLAVPLSVPPLVVTADGELVILQGPDGLYSARTDGADAEPALLGPHKGFVGVALAQDGRTVITGGDGTLNAAEAGVAGSQRLIATGLEQPLTQAVFAPNGRLVFRAGPKGALQVASVTSSVPDVTDLVPSTAQVDSLISLTPDESHALVELGGERHGLALVDLAPLQAPDEPTPYGPPHDAAEVFVGWAPAP